MTIDEAHRRADTYHASMLATVEQTGDENSIQVYRAMRPYISHAYRSGFADGVLNSSTELLELFAGHAPTNAGSEVVVKIAE